MPELVDAALLLVVVLSVNVAPVVTGCRVYLLTTAQRRIPGESPSFPVAPDSPRFSPEKLH